MSITFALTGLIAVPMCSSALVYLLGRMGPRRTSGIPLMLSRWMALIALVVTAVFLVTVGQYVIGVYDTDIMLGVVHLHMDAFGLVLAGVAVGLGILAVLFSHTYMKGEVGEEKFYALLVAMIGTMIGLSCAADLFNLWVWFETMAVTSYMLVAFYREQAASLEAGVKYLVQSATGSVLVLLGIALVYARTGFLTISSITEIASTKYAGDPLLLAGGALLLIGFGVKSALVPLHTWLPDAHSQAPSGISAMLSGVVIEAGLVAMLRALGALSGVTNSWAFLLLGFGAVNMLLGNLMALRQTQLKRMLAYSSVSHMGYILVGIGMALTTGLVTGASGGLFHLINHALMKGLAFLAAGALLYALYIGKGQHNSPLMVEDLNGAARRYPLVALCLSIAVLGLGGLPPLAGFMSKWQIFVSGFQAQTLAAALLAIFMALNSVLSLAYYAPLVNRMYRRQPSEVVAAGGAVTWQIAVPLLALALAVVAIGFYPGLVTGLTDPAGYALLGIFGR